MTSATFPSSLHLQPLLRRVVKIFFGFSVLSFADKDQGGVVEAEKGKEMGWRNKEKNRGG